MSKKIFCIYLATKFFRRRHVLSSVCSVRPSRGGRRYVLAVASVGTREGGGKWRVQRNSRLHVSLHHTVLISFFSGASLLMFVALKPRVRCMCDNLQSEVMRQKKMLIVSFFVYFLL